MSVPIKYSIALLFVSDKLKLGIPSFHPQYPHSKSPEFMLGFCAFLWDFSGDCRLPSPFAQTSTLRSYRGSQPSSFFRPLFFEVPPVLWCRKHRLGSILGVSCCVNMPPSYLLMCQRMVSALPSRSRKDVTGITICFGLTLPRTRGGLEFRLSFHRRRSRSSKDRKDAHSILLSVR